MPQQYLSFIGRLLHFDLGTSIISSRPVLDDLAAVLGSLYVIEGSALGGRVIAPQLKRTLGLTQGAGASYFHGFGGETAAMWSNFRVLAALEIGESSRDTVTASTIPRSGFVHRPMSAVRPLATTDRFGLESAIQTEATSAG